MLSLSGRSRLIVSGGTRVPALLVRRAQNGSFLLRPRGKNGLLAPFARWNSSQQSGAHSEVAPGADVEAANDTSTDDEKGSKVKGMLTNMKRLAQFAVPAKRELIYGVSFLPIALGSTMAMPMIVGKIVDQISTANDVGAPLDINTTIATLLGISTAGALATMGRSYFINLGTEIVTKNIRNSIFKSVMAKNITFFDKSKTGDLVNRLSADTTVISSTLTESLSMFLRGAGTVTLGTGFLVYTSWQLAAVSMATIAPVAIISRLYGTFIKRNTKKQLDMLGESTAVAEEVFSNARTVRLFAREESEQHRYEKEVEKTFAIGKRIALMRGFFMGGSNFVMATSMLSVVGYGAHLVTSGAMTPGQLTTFLMYALNIGGSFFSIASVFTSIMKALGAGERVFALTDNAKDSEENRVQGKTLDNLAGAITFHGVDFAYPTRSEQDVFSGLNLEIPAGKVVAVLGPSGSGKSTLIGLLARFYEPNKGDVLVDGHPVSSLNLEWLREQIGTVSQDAAVFNTTLMDNIRYGKPNATDEEVYEAARKANAHTFIIGFPYGYDTMVGQRGTSLSGGQKQRICIARAILKDPKILVLDEATSALDVENEWAVQQALDRVMVGRTVVVIAHRLSTIKNADYIAVLEGGKVAEFGTRDEVMEVEDGLFNQYVARQEVANKKSIV